LSFFHRPALHFLRAWSHTRMYAPGARKNCALSGEKNPALTHQAGYSRFNIPPHLFQHPSPFNFNFQAAPLPHEIKSQFCSIWPSSNEGRGVVC